jgi:ABC-type proline/glycine betaine transport system permease subunit
MRMVATVLASVVLGGVLGLVSTRPNSAAFPAVATAAVGQTSPSLCPRLMWLRTPPMHTPAGLQ